MPSRSPLGVALVLAVSCANVSSPTAVVAPISSAAPGAAPSLDPSAPSDFRDVPTTAGQPSADENVAAMGIPECDDYLAAWNACRMNKPSRVAGQRAIDGATRAWRKSLERGVTSKSDVARACKFALDNFPKAACW